MPKLVAPADQKPADQEPADQTPADQKPAPWGDDFDAERAWALVQKLRQENSELKTERDTLKTASETQAAEGKTEVQKLADELAALKQRAADADRKLALKSVLVEFPDLADFEDLLTGDDEAAIRAKAERLAAIGKGKKPAAEEEQQTPGVPEKPKPNLTPGHGGDASTPFDPVAIAKAARGQ